MARKILQDRDELDEKDYLLLRVKMVSENEKVEDNGDYNWDKGKVKAKDEDEEGGERQRPPGRVWHCRHHSLTPPRQSPPLLGTRPADPPM